MLMQPRPIAETSRLLFPSFRFFIFTPPVMSFSYMMSFVEGLNYRVLQEYRASLSALLSRSCDVYCVLAVKIFQSRYFIQTCILLSSRSEAYSVFDDSLLALTSVTSRS